MRVLWAINIMPPDILEEFGLKPGHAISWVDAMSKALIDIDDITLALAAPASVDTIQKMTYDGITYFLFPRNVNLVDSWKAILSDFQPDLIHVYGTEQIQNYTLIKNFNNFPIVVSLQGLLGEYQRYYYCGLTEQSIKKYRSLREIIKDNDIKKGQKSFCYKSEQEADALKSAKYVEGRSLWDKEASLKINDSLKYYHCPRMIRRDFFDYHWDDNNFERHSIFVHQGDYPIKRTHILFDAINIVKKKYPDVKIYIAGNKMHEESRFNELYRGSSYKRILSEKIRKYKLDDNICYLGRLSAAQVAEKLSKVNVCINCSSIENVPNSVAEAMIVGTPIIASCVGGTTELLNFGECGFLYSYDDYTMLAALIKYVFENVDKAKIRSERAKRVAYERHDPKKLVNTLLSIYKDVLKCEAR